MQGRSLVCGGQPSPHKPRLVVSHSTCPPLSSSPHAHSFVLGTAVINTHTHVEDQPQYRGLCHSGSPSARSFSRSPSPPIPSFTQSPSPPRLLVRDGQTSPQRPRLVVTRSTCPPISPSPHANSFVIVTALPPFSRRSPFFASQRMILMSSPPLASMLPSKDQATVLTQALPFSNSLVNALPHPWAAARRCRQHEQ